MGSSLTRRVTQYHPTSKLTHPGFPLDYRDLQDFAGGQNLAGCDAVEALREFGQSTSLTRFVKLVVTVVTTNSS